MFQLNTHEKLTRAEIIEKRKKICNMIYEIELIYDMCEFKERQKLDQKLLNHGKELLKLSFPRKTVEYLYGNEEGSTLLNE